VSRAIEPVSTAHDLTGTSLWDGLSLAKFRAPRQRDLVKARFYCRWRNACHKTTVWYGFPSMPMIQTGFFSLVASLRDIPLRWDVDPSLLVAQVRGGGQSSRTIANVLVSALASVTDHHLILMLNVTDTGTLSNSFVTQALQRTQSGASAIRCRQGCQSPPVRFFCAVSAGGAVTRSC